MADLRGKRLLVTGGTGFNQVDPLLPESCTKIVAVDNMIRGQPDNLNVPLRHSKVRLVVGDSTDTAMLGRWIADSDLVFHLAPPHYTFRGGASPR